MAQYTTTTYTCDNCDKKLSICDNTMNIMTKLSDDNYYWKRLHVLIKEKHGSHNSGEENDAELCKKCAIALLTDAIERIKKGERTTKGTVHAEQEGWNK